MHNWVAVIIYWYTKKVNCSILEHEKLLTCFNVKCKIAFMQIIRGYTITTKSYLVWAQNMLVIVRNLPLLLNGSLDLLTSTPFSPFISDSGLFFLLVQFICEHGNRFWVWTKTTGLPRWSQSQFQRNSRVTCRLQVWAKCLLIASYSLRQTP